MKHYYGCDKQTGRQSVTYSSVSSLISKGSVPRFCKKQKNTNFKVNLNRIKHRYIKVCDNDLWKSRKENPQKLTQLSSRSHPRHLVGKKAQKDTIIDITSDSQVNSNFPYRWSPASLTLNKYFYLFLYLYIT